jgi:ferredoxin
MDCCRTARRLGGEEVKVIVRSPFEDMKASPWEKEDAIHEDIPIIDNHVPKEFVVEDGKLVGMRFEKVKAVYDDKGRRSLVPTEDEPVFYPCDDVLMAIGQENSFPWIERDIGIVFDKWGLPVLDTVTFQSTNPKVFFGGDSAFGPANIITAVAHAHQAAISIDLFCNGKDVSARPAPGTNLVSQKMGIHEWSYDSQVDDDDRYKVPHADKVVSLKDRKMEVELGFDVATAYREAERCLNCDVQTVFGDDRCIECDACVDICPTDCINFIDDAPEEALRGSLKVPATNLDQPLYVSGKLKTGRVMVKDEDVCLHCGLCAERCPTSAWDMQKFLYEVTKAAPLCNV